ncbi:hypothetical protein fugu_006701 [Takifugu bimaculatus]|uniref:Hyaluronidase n=1 Tax=Takifugu bimaculatus TaxID=433685 RepID=A0A4Z2B2A8_9TELE|nr:hypothetical protein fugu_006701 [Takifugu bimaculatus]
MGTAGVVIWERSETKTERECQDLAEFVTMVLGPYSSNVTTAARLCSASLCQGKGRCVRQNPNSSAYLHLPTPSEAAEKATGKPEEEKATEELEGTTNTAEPDPAEIWKKDFQCQWYKTADGDVSDQLSPKDGAAASVGGEQVDALRSTTASSVAATKAASVSGSPQPSPAAPTDGGPRQVGAPTLTALLLLTAVGLCVEP